MIIKPGVKTTEFWGVIAVNIGNLAAAIQGSLDPKWASIASAISIGLYALSRALTKTAA